MPACSTCCVDKPVFSSAQLKRKSADRRCVECVNDLGFDEKRKQLCLWLLKHGATLKVSITEESGFRSLLSNERIPKNDEVVFIPQKCMMTMIAAKNCQLAQKANEIIPPGAITQQTWLALYLIEEKRKKEKSFFHPYIALLPKHYKDMPVCFTEQEIEALKGSICESMVKMKQLSLKQEFLAVEQLGVSFSEFVWARTAVITRVFNCKIARSAQDASSNKLDTECLVPIADMMNHAREPSTQWAFDSERDGFRMASVKPILSASEMFDSYGDKCNSRYFINYGFTLANNQASNQAALFFDCPESLIGVNCKRNFDDGFSGYAYCIENKLETRVSQDLQFRFQVPIISDHLPETCDKLIRAMFAFVGGDSSPSAMPFTVAKIADSARQSLKLLERTENPEKPVPSFESMLAGEREVLQFYIDLHEFMVQSPTSLRGHSRFGAYWNMFHKLKK